MKAVEWPKSHVACTPVELDCCEPRLHARGPAREGAAGMQLGSVNGGSPPGRRPGSHVARTPVERGWPGSLPAGQIVIYRATLPVITFRKALYVFNILI
jgi:hypothetical protein